MVKNVKYLESINRIAILVKPKPDFYIWLNRLMGHTKPIEKLEENNIYLVREMDSDNDIREWLKKNYEHIFSNELNDWYTDQKAWPQNRTFKIFDKWFEVEVHSMVLDMEDELPVDKEEVA